MERGAWQATVHGVAKSRTQLKQHTHTHTHTHNMSRANKSTKTVDKWSPKTGREEEKELTGYGVWREVIKIF